MGLITDIKQVLQHHTAGLDQLLCAKITELANQHTRFLASSLSSTTYDLSLHLSSTAPASPPLSSRTSASNRLRKSLLKTRRFNRTIYDKKGVRRTPTRSQRTVSQRNQRLLTHRYQKLSKEFLTLKAKGQTESSFGQQGSQPRLLKSTRLLDSSRSRKHFLKSQLRQSTRLLRSRKRPSRHNFLSGCNTRACRTQSSQPLHSNSQHDWPRRDMRAMWTSAPDLAVFCNQTHRRL